MGIVLYTIKSEWLSQIYFIIFIFFKFKEFNAGLLIHDEKLVGIFSNHNVVNPIIRGEIIEGIFAVYNPIYGELLNDDLSNGESS